MDISITAGMKNSLLSLKDTARLVDRTQERLATGRKVNTPLDNPTNYFAATALRNSASDIDHLHDRITEGIQTIKAANTGLAGITSLLENMKGLVAAADMTSDPNEQIKLSNTFDELYAQLNNLVKDSGYGGTNLIADSDTDPLTVTPSDLTIPLNRQGSAEYVVEGKFMGSGYALYETPGSLPALIPDERGEYLSGYGTSVGNISDVSLVIRFNPHDATVGDVNGDGVLQAGEGTEIDFRLVNSGSATALNVGYSNASTSTGWNFLTNPPQVFGNVAPGSTVISDNLSDLDLNIPAGTDGIPFTISLDFSSDGVTKNLTFGPITVGNITNGQVMTANVNASSGAIPSVQTDSLNIYSADYANGIFGVTFPGTPPVDKTLYADKQGLEIYHSWVYSHFQTQEGIDAAKLDLQNALAAVRGYTAEIGTSSSVVVTRNDFNSDISNVYTSGADNLTLADMNEEAANMLMLQTRQNLSITSLSLASQAAQGVLRILA